MRERLNSLPALIHKDGTLPPSPSTPAHQGESMGRKWTTRPMNTPGIQMETEGGEGKWRSPEMGIWVRLSKEQEKLLKIKNNLN